MDRFESKYRNTALKMDQALLQLLYKKEFQDISIMEICESANVNRSTFYSHYQNTYELLNETKDLMINNFLEEYSELSEGIKDIDFSEINAEQSIFVNEKYLIPYLNYVKKHKYLYKIYHKNSIQFGRNDHLTILVNSVFVPIFSKFGITDKKIIKYISSYYVSGITAIIDEWVRNDCVDDVMLICEMINLCVRVPTN